MGPENFSEPFRPVLLLFQPCSNLFVTEIPQVLIGNYLQFRLDCILFVFFSNSFNANYYPSF